MPKLGTKTMIHNRRAAMVSKGLACWWIPRYNLKKALRVAGL